MDKISYLIILRALFIFSLINSGWTVKKGKEKNNFQMYKTVKNK